jgi:altronate dehydratase large subunit
MRGYLRADGRKGIRNTVIVAYLVECAHHVAREIAAPFREHDVHVIGFAGCYPNAYAETMMRRLCTHPNVGAALLVSLGCESFNRNRLAQAIRESGRPAQTIVIQASGGTRKSIAEGRAVVAEQRSRLDAMEAVPMQASELVVGTVCGGSDGTSGITGNPAAGRAFDLLVEEGAACIFEETGELIGCEHIMADADDFPHDLARNPQLSANLLYRLAQREIGAAHFGNRLHNQHSNPGLPDLGRPVWTRRHGVPIG